MGEKVEFNDAAEPSNILWENLAFSKRRVVLRKTVGILFAIIFTYLILIMFTVAKANVTQKYLTNVDQGKCIYVENLFES